MSLEKLRESNAECRACPLRRKCPRVACSAGDGGSGVAVVAAGPMGAEAVAMLAKLLRSAGLEKSECLIAGVVRCHSEKPPKVAEIEACKPWLWRELTVVKPRVIVALGKLPTALLFRARPLSSLEMGPLWNLPHPQPYLPGRPIVVPIRTPEALLKGNMKHVQEAVDALTWSRVYAAVPEAL